MRLPPRWVRRVVGPVVLVVSLALALTLLPVLVLVAAVASLWLEGSWRGLRLLGFGLIGLTVELSALVAAAALWVLSEFGRGLHTPRYQRAHYTLLRTGLNVLARSAQRPFKLRLKTDDVSWSPLDDGVPGSENAMIVLARHAGPGDSLLLMDTLMNRDHLREPRIVLKDTMQLDPVVDTFFNGSRRGSSIPTMQRGRKTTSKRRSRHLPPASCGRGFAHLPGGGQLLTPTTAPGHRDASTAGAHVVRRPGRAHAFGHAAATRRGERRPGSGTECRCGLRRAHRTRAHRGDARCLASHPAGQDVAPAMVVLRRGRCPSGSRRSARLALSAGPTSTRGSGPSKAPERCLRTGQPVGRPKRSRSSAATRSRYSGCRSM